MTVLSRFRRRLQRSETLGPVALAIVVGLVAGLGAIVLRTLIAGVQWVFFTALPGLTLSVGFPEGISRIQPLFAPAIGMIIVAHFVRRVSPEAAGHGVPEVQFAVRQRDGRIRPRTILGRSVASAISIGSGGSVGREGPIVHVGSALGSVVGQLAGLGPEQIRLLVACGAAGAIASTFNAPIAGVMFALEVILATFAARAFGLVVISAVAATALSQAVLGTEPAFHLSQSFTLVSEWEFLLYMVLGGITGLLSVAYVRTVYWMEELFERWKAGITVKALVGGLAVGSLGYFGSQHIFGVGHEGVELALGGDLVIGLMVALVVMKILATSITLAAGGSGGIFAPGLFIGAMAGGAFGAVANMLFPAWTAPAGAYALVGMGALIAATAHAPIMAVMILFEMTDNYQIILPLMSCGVLSYLIAYRVFPDSMYSIKLRHLGGLAQPGHQASVLDFVLVVDTMSEDFETVGPELTVDELARMARTRRTTSWPVVDGEGVLLGIVTDTDLRNAVLTGTEDVATVAEVMTTSVIACTPGDSLRTAFRKLAERDMQLVPVLESPTDSTLVGVLRRHEMLWAYRELSEEHTALLDRAAGFMPAPREEAVQIEYVVGPEDRRVGFRHVRDLALPEHALVVLVRRAGRAFVPRGDTRIEPGDEMVLLTIGQHADELRSWVAGDQPIEDGGTRRSPPP